MCRPTDAKVVADAKAAAAPKSTWKKRLALVAAGAAVYFSRARSHAPTPWTPSAKVALPAVEAELEMLSNVPRFVWWKRDGGLRLESVMTVRMLNKKPLPLKMRGANFTNLFAMESSSSGSQSPSPSGGGGGGRQLYEAGWQSLGNFTIPPFGEVTLPSRYVLDDLRPSMVVALLADAFWKREVVIHQAGTLQLSPFGSVEAKCELTIPVPPPKILKNRCRIRAL